MSDVVHISIVTDRDVENGVFGGGVGIFTIYTLAYNAFYLASRKIYLRIGLLVVFVFLLYQLFFIYNFHPLYQAVKHLFPLNNIHNIVNSFNFPFSISKILNFIDGVAHFDVFEAVFDALK